MDVTFVSVLTDGNVLVPSVLDTMITSTANGTGVTSEIDGNLEAVNFSAGFTVKAEHIKPGAVMRYSQEGSVVTMDWTDALFSPESADEIAGSTVIPSDSAFIGIPGTCSHIYLPYNCTAVKYSCSMFVTVYRHRERLDAQNLNSPQMFLQMFIDGTHIQSTVVRMPETYRHNTAADMSSEWERLNTRQYDFTFMSIAGANNFNLAGWHRMSIKARIVPNGGVEDYVKPNKKTGTITTPTSIGQRMRFGIRNSRIIAFK